MFFRKSILPSMIQKKPDRSSSGVYRDKLKPLLDSTDAGHLLSIFSYTGEGACIEHVDRGFITLVTKSQEEWGLVIPPALCKKLAFVDENYIVFYLTILGNPID